MSNILSVQLTRIPSDRGDVLCVVTRPLYDEHVDDFHNHIARVKPVKQVLGVVTHWSGYGPNRA